MNWSRRQDPSLPCSTSATARSPVRRCRSATLVTAWRSTAIPNIAMFVHVPGDAFPEGDLSRLSDGPTVEEREAHPARAVAEVTGADGRLMRGMVETVNGYTYTPLAAVEAARSVSWPASVGASFQNTRNRVRRGLRGDDVLGRASSISAMLGAATLLQQNGREARKRAWCQNGPLPSRMAPEKDVQTTT